MKKTIYFFSFIIILAMVEACGSKKETKNTEEYVANESATEAAPAGDAISMGESLVKASDCKTCHHSTNKIIGPSHTDVAKKYEFTKANVEMLAQKIIKGGTGVWGQVPMSPHADVSEADAEKMARYVLSLDGEKEH
ncbi:MAG TPA: c-type cytochrome [Cyclobacteriaceae bacterium]|jgi:cytochrome c|nr:c-type cytochrome [Cyclobacteriaceae bacterium]